jgi:hypothetical protein
MEENTHNPTIAKVPVKECANYFLIKYKNEEERVAYSDLIIRLAKNHELKDFHIEEKEAFKDSRVLYNMHTVLGSGEFNYDKLEKEFLKLYEK